MVCQRRRRASLMFRWVHLTLCFIRRTLKRSAPMRLKSDIKFAKPSYTNWALFRHDRGTTQGRLGCFLIRDEVSRRELMESTELARLRRVAGKQTTRLTHYGRKTGKPHEVTIWFVLDDDRLYIGTANVKRQWVRNVQKTPEDQAVHRRRDFRGQRSFPHRPRRARTGDGCDSTEVLDVSTHHWAWARPHRDGTNERQ
jgi:F420H(2)-dependent quinone reductase